MSILRGILHENLFLTWYRTYIMTRRIVRLFINFVQSFKCLFVYIKLNDIYIKFKYLRVM